MQLLTILGGIATLIAGLAGTYAVIVARRTEQKTASREELDSALTAQGHLLDRYERRIADLETKTEDAMAERNEIKLAHIDCQRRLEAAEEKLERLSS